MAANSTLKWVNEVKYLGIHLKSSANVTFNWQPTRSNFYKALNNIMGALGPNPPINVPLSLIRAKCFPILTYGIEAIHLSVSDTKKFSFAYNNIFYKLFKSNDANVIGQY